MAVDFYNETTHLVRFESDTFGASIYLDLTMKLIRIGNFVTLTWATDNRSMASGTGDDNLTTLSGDELPAIYRPLTTLDLAVRIHNNGSNVNGTYRIGTDGTITCGRGDFPSNNFIFNAGSQNLIYGGSVSYGIT